MPVTLDTSCSLVVFSKEELFKVKTNQPNPKKTKKKIKGSTGQTGEVAVKYLIPCYLPALDRCLGWCMRGNSLCFCFHWIVSTVCLNIPPCLGMSQFYSRVLWIFLSSFPVGQEWNLLQLLVLFWTHELLKQDAWGDCRLACEGFRHHCLSRREN